jgi:protein-S-isoprenylcysteine O-methyltransferase Ste14
VCAQAEHRLITNGPYARLRHPIYSGLLLAMLGTAIAGNQVRMYLAIPIAFCAFWYKSRLEERLLLHAIGARYQQYHQRTRAMIPGVL